MHLGPRGAAQLVKCLLRTHKDPALDKRSGWHKPDPSTRGMSDNESEGFGYPWLHRESESSLHL